MTTWLALAIVKYEIKHNFALAHLSEATKDDKWLRNNNNNEKKKETSTASAIRRQ